MQKYSSDGPRKKTKQEPYMVTSQETFLYFDSTYMGEISMHFANESQFYPIRSLNVYDYHTLLILNMYASVSEQSILFKYFLQNFKELISMMRPTSQNLQSDLNGNKTIYM